MNVVEALLWVGPISILCMLPAMCAYDLMERRVPLSFFGAILSINLIPTCLIWCLGGLLWQLLAAQVVMCVLAFGAWKYNLIGGADRNLLICIFMFFMWVPCGRYLTSDLIPIETVMVFLSFINSLIWALILTPACIFAFNLGMGYHRDYAREYRDRGEILVPQKPYTLKEMFLRINGGIPMVLPVAVAFVYTMWCYL